MPTRTCWSGNGNDRLVVSTICTHLPFFHEAGFEFRTERRQRLSIALWNPATWRGERWAPGVDTLQPIGLRCIFIQRGNIERDPLDFDATTETRDGVVKLSCEYMLARAHCVHVVRVRQSASVPAAHETDDARSVVNVCVRFTYDGEEHVLWHAPRRSTTTVTRADNASIRTR